MLGAAAAPWAWMPTALAMAEPAALAGGTELRGRPVQEKQAEPATQATSAPRFELTAPLLINDRYLGDVDVLVDRAGRGDADGARLLFLLDDVLVPEALAPLEAAIEAGNGRFALDALPDGPLSLTFDVGLIELRAQVDPMLFGAANVSLSTAPPVDRSAFGAPAPISAALALDMSQSLRWQHADEQRDAVRTDRLAADALAYARWDRAGLSAFAEFEYRQTDGLARREAFLLKDWEEGAVRLLAGDVLPLPAGFQSARPILGLSVARRWNEIQPLRNVFAAGRQDIVLDQDSTVEVFVNGERVEVLELPAGPVTLTDFPFAQGANEVELLVRDEVGAEERIAFGFFNQGQVLTRGLTDFAAAAGTERRFSPRGFSYGGGLQASGYVRHGLTNAATVGANLQASGRATQLGAEATIGSRFGLVTAQAAGSWAKTDDEASGGDGEVFGAAGSLVHRLQLFAGDAPLTGTTVVTAYTADFAGLGGVQRNPALAVRSTVRGQAGPVILSASASYQKERAGRADRTGLRLDATRRFGRLTGRVGAEYTKAEGADAEFGLTFGLNVPLGQRGFARAQHRTKGGVWEGEVGRTPLNRPFAAGGTLRVRTSDDADEAVARANVVHNRFDASLDASRVEPRGMGAATSAARWRLGTMIGYADGEVGVGRPSPDGFVLVERHRTLKGARVSLQRAGSDEAEASAGLLGNGLVPIRRNYVPVRLRAAVAPLPSGYDIGSGEIAVLPPPGAGYALTVGSDASRTVLGIVRGADGAPIARRVGTIRPLGADVDGAEGQKVFTNARGRFVAEKMAAGEYVLDFGDEQQFVVRVDEDAVGVVDVGEIEAE